MPQASEIKRKVNLYMQKMFTCIQTKLFHYTYEAF